MLKSFLKDICLKLLGKHRFLPLLSREIEDNWTILDVGCGGSSPLKFIKKGSYRVGLDAYQFALSESKRLSIHDEYVLGDAKHLPFKDNSFDCVIAIEVLEHLRKQDGSKMIREMERVAKKKIILTTPNGFFDALPGPDDNNLLYGRHQSGWTVNELRKFGFKIHGLNGLKWLFKSEPGQIIIKFGKIRFPKIIGRLMIGITQLFTYFQPSLAFQLFCIKEIGVKK